MNAQPIEVQAASLAKKLSPLVREMLLAEVVRVAAEAAPAKRTLDAQARADAEIMDSCLEVAAATDRLAQQKFGPGETLARRQLERACTALGRVLRKHGRMPKGEI